MGREFPEGGSWPDVQSMPHHLRRLHAGQQAAIRRSRPQAKTDADGRPWLGLRGTVWLGGQRVVQRVRRAVSSDDYPSL